MIVNNKGPVTNQQNIENGGTGYFYAESKNNIRECEDVKKIRNIIIKNCTQYQQEVLLQVIDELCKSINNGEDEAKKSSIWIEKIRTAISTFGSIASITNAAWWPVLIDSVENLIRNL